MEGEKKYLVLETHDENLTNIFKKLETVININWNEKRLSFRAGNNYFGGFNLLNDNKLKMDMLAGTQMFCMDPDVQAIEKFMSNFFQGKELNLEFNGDFLTFLLGAEKVVCKVQ